MSSVEIESPPSEVWRLGQLRFTAFTGVPILADETLFHKFFGFPCDTSTTKKNELTEHSTAKGGVTYKCSIFFGINKIDFTATADFTDDESPVGFPLLPDTEDFVTVFVSGAQGVLPQLNSIKRLAVGGTYLSLVDTREEAYAKLGSKLNIPLDPHKCSDFQYRINIPANGPTADKSVIFNRISTWNSVRMQLLAVVYPMQPTQVNEEDAVVSDAISVSTDVNTLPKFDLSTLKPEDLISVVDDLFELSRQIPVQGIVL